MPIQLGQLKEFKNIPAYNPVPVLKEIKEQLLENNKCISTLGTTTGNVGLALVRLDHVQSPFQFGNHYIKAFPPLLNK